MALRQINMIPGNILARTDLVRHLWFWGKGLVFILLLFVMFYLAQASRFALQQKAQHSDASMKVIVTNKIEQALKKADGINMQMQDLKLKAGLLATLTNQQLYYDILAVFAHAFNDATWIDHLSIQRGNEKDTDRSNLMVDGFSLTHNTLGAFLESLSGNNRIQDVVLVYAKKQEQKSPDLDVASLIQFKLTCSIIKGPLK
ncbi:MAG: PilN domain-containing protein [Proteobacteria bacterium]|nr:PilN domain-containing protein [Pseudomonadota bacterium]